MTARAAERRVPAVAKRVSACREGRRESFSGLAAARPAGAGRPWRWHPRS